MVLAMVGAHMAQTFSLSAGGGKFLRVMNWAMESFAWVYAGDGIHGAIAALGFDGGVVGGGGGRTGGRVPVIGDWIAQFILGGSTIGGATLSRFFAIHVFLMPGCMFAFIGLYLWLVLRHGISEPPVPGPAGGPEDLPEGISRTAAEIRASLLARMGRGAISFLGRARW